MAYPQQIDPSAFNVLEDQQWLEIISFKFSWKKAQVHYKELWIMTAMVYYQGAYHVLASLYLES
jgi:hypothetical protein